MTQVQKILNYLKENREITSLAAYQSLHITQLAARLTELKEKYGEVIEDRWMDTPNARVKAYRLTDEFRDKLNQPKKPFPKLDI